MKSRQDGRVAGRVADLDRVMLLSTVIGAEDVQPRPLRRQQRQARRRALKHLIARLFDGSSTQLVLNVLDDEDLDPAEVRRLKKVIEES